MPDMDTGHERARIDRGLNGDTVAAPMPGGKVTLAPPSQLFELTWRTPPSEIFGAWRQPGPDHHRLGLLLLRWGIVLVGLGVAAGFYGLM